LLRRSPTALACDQLEAAGGTRSNQHGLDDALDFDRVGQRRRRLGVEAASRLAWVRVDRLDREVCELGLRRAADQDLEAAAKTSARLVSWSVIGHDTA
jgi:hypothetical protein